MGECGHERGGWVAFLAAALGTGLNLCPSGTYFGANASWMAERAAVL